MTEHLKARSLYPA